MFACWGNQLQVQPRAFSPKVIWGVNLIQLCPFDFELFICNQNVTISNLSQSFWLSPSAAPHTASEWSAAGDSRQKGAGGFWHRGGLKSITTSKVFPWPFSGNIYHPSQHPSPQSLQHHGYLRFSGRLGHRCSHQRLQRSGDACGGWNADRQRLCDWEVDWPDVSCCSCCW